MRPPVKTTRYISNPFVLLFSFTLLLSAGLTFIIQPMIGKMLLPLVGGAPSGWLVAMTYFQIVLLAGYAIAHIFSRIPPYYHVIAVIFLLVGGLLTFPLRIHAEFIESGMPEALGVLFALAASLTLPAIALFSLSPSLQRLFNASQNGQDPYFLFAASNLGSLGGLLAYPFFVERISGLSTQIRMWEKGYGLLIVLCLLCLWTARKGLKVPAKRARLAPSTKTTWRLRGQWVILAFIPSSLMLGVTAQITTDSGSVPFFWIIPLSLYLLTFILAFARRRLLDLKDIDFLQTASIALLAVFFIRNPAVVSLSEHMFFPLVAFFLTAWFCHGTLAAARPDTSRLTEFYLCIAVGGAMGGIFNSFAAPFLFPLPIEFLLVALMSCLIPRTRAILKNPQIKRLIWIFAILAVIGTLIFRITPTDLSLTTLRILYGTGMAILACSLVIISFQPRLLAGLSVILGCFSFLLVHNHHLLDVHRNFFGVLRVTQSQQEDVTVRTLMHGSTVHGLEKVAPQIDTTPSSYYDSQGPLGELVKLKNPVNVGLVGMGTGTALCYKAPKRHFTVYELDPDVPPLAAKWFDYVHACGMPDIRIGDGRRQLEKTSTKHDFIILDAFSSDSIPVHLLTREAFQTYFDRLTPDGILAVHISNRFYDLRFPVSGIVQNLDLKALYKDFLPSPSPVTTASRWVVVSRNEKQIKPLLQREWRKLPQSEKRVWTDDFSDTLSALYIFHSRLKAPHAQTH